jgi:hypothetical protein
MFKFLMCRRKRSLAEFQAEVEGCESKRCTILKCKVGPLEKDESVLFRVRSRLYTETQVKVRGEFACEFDCKVYHCCENRIREEPPHFGRVGSITYCGSTG